MIRKIYNVFCDTCPMWVSEENSAEAARKEARSQGWICSRKDGDICPACQIGAGDRAIPSWDRNKCEVRE